VGLLLLPLALWQDFGGSWNHLAVVPAATLVAIFFFGIEAGPGTEGPPAGGRPPRPHGAA